ncbi:transcriptional regulator BetI [Alteromonas mediterranea]|jgi:TetR/AcrR family transcriptional regulator, transcriptional repressor of bet genes|uniref:HTH-type transcriptional regulator BetI n=2 Tax=Alteromonas mediterranea TaxID=314275 RepID=A0AAC9NR19_9ALTE|nr:transcriptional regulator BetI [Alteromonas mediterranea]AFV84612.1 transcriptional regulator BetI [Alteromonas mediterranea DE1]AGP96620.1 transcriptional regulator BetI [Alteromonas mediterranea UM7]AGQ00956.1 transcriptional regulator BetI [Alteromonas mediterranea UM4b]AMJ77785.1 transcriptional repressor BetI [Alteromonas mediterranea]AMJ81930.1 transcriptional repressor BetI [Alteromonas mediterranea]|tara:strand:- start:2352 stop:2927 length:576 start_codon:yes stop_codon:yes gene_type:complete
MPKVGMEPVRKKQLIEATLEVMAEVGYHGTTISLISKRAGLSSGIISHYFGDKQGLIEATMRHLLEALKITKRIDDPLKRIDFIIENNFSQTQGASSATNTWFNFWALSLHNEGLHRLQCINHKRLERNLAFSYRKLLKPEQVKNAAASTAALIDGYWLRYSMGSVGNGDFTEAVTRCKQYVRDLITQYAK